MARQLVALSIGANEAAWPERDSSRAYCAGI